MQNLNIDDKGDAHPADVPAEKQEDEAISFEDESFRKLFVGGLDPSTTTESMRAFYSQFGSVPDCIVLFDQITGRSRCFGFVTFGAKAEVDKAMESRPHVIDGKQVDSKRAVPRDQSMRGERNVSTQRLYVSGIREEHTEQMLEEYFREFGKVEKVEVVKDRDTNLPRGFGFVTFDDYDCVDKCVLIKAHQIGGFRCDVKKALSRVEMAKAQQMDKDRAERGARLRQHRGGPGWQQNSQDGGGHREWREGRGRYNSSGSWNNAGQQASQQSGQQGGQFYSMTPMMAGQWGMNYEQTAYTPTYDQQQYAANVYAPYYAAGWTSDATATGQWAANSSALGGGWGSTGGFEASGPQSAAYSSCNQTPASNYGASGTHHPTGQNLRF